MNVVLPIVQRQCAPAVVIPPDAWFPHTPPYSPSQRPFIGPFSVPNETDGERRAVPLQCDARGVNSRRGLWSAPQHATQESPE
ncbi:hypothetical protein PCA31118_00853 [Pandoraea captiosa]|uniref:Uncharacterized protein n=1 Tax=Pandoraea captiosa TaxID=2508302 RepID=A0A5E4ZNZ2_9BURK|nr:hypothetical protein PCA31118_00853 [Pandoraea captiosa]